MNPTSALLWLLLASAETSPPPVQDPAIPTAGQAQQSTPTAAPARATPPPSPPPAPPPAAAPPRPRPTSPFRLGMTYLRVLSEDGDANLANDGYGTNAVGLDFVSPSSTYVRNHLGLAHQWESSGTYSARGFRIDLISLGYPIRLLDSEVRLDLEPILTVVRGEMMFVSGGGRFLRMESGFGLELSATFRHWFFCVQPLAIDFRYWVYRSVEPQSLTGLGRIFPLRIAIGYEF